MLALALAFLSVGTYPPSWTAVPVAALGALLAVKAGATAGVRWWVAAFLAGLASIAAAMLAVVAAVVALYYWGLSLIG